jgi:hypothetical protein
MGDIEIKYQVGDSDKWMVVTKNKSGKLIKVTDEEGTPALDGDLSEASITKETGVDPRTNDVTNKKPIEIKFRAPLSSIPDHTTFLSQHNPTCRWYFYGGKWYLICDG